MTQQWWLRMHGKDHLLDDAGRPVCGTVARNGAVRVNRAVSACSRCAETDQLRRRGSAIEALLEWLEHADMRREAGQPPDVPTPRFFDGAMPLLSHDDGFSTRMAFIPSEELVDVSDLRQPLDVRQLTLGDTAKGTHVALQRWRALPAAAIRGRVKHFFPHPIEWTMAFPESGHWSRVYVGRIGLRRWVQLPQSPRMAGGRGGAYRVVQESGINESDEELTRRVQSSIALGVGRYHVWRVYLGFEGKPGLEFPTDPLGAREVFRLRDIPEGRDRRLALRHWVEQHWRANRADPAEEILVRRHLRGATEFSWSGLHCRISPSDADRATLNELLEERAEARRAGTDRRPTPAVAGIGS